MGIYDQPRNIGASPDFYRFGRPEAPDGSVLGAAFRTENLVGSAIANSSQPVDPFASDEDYLRAFDTLPDSDYNPWQDIEGTQYEDYWSEFAGSRSINETRRLKSRIDRELRDRAILANAGGRGVAAQLFAGFVDVPSLVPGAAVVRGGTKGFTIGRNAFNGGRASLAEAAAVEGMLQSMQSTRTAEESSLAIGGSVVLGAILGGGVGAMLRRTPDGQAALDNASSWLDGNDPEPGVGLDRALRDAEAESLSAARVDVVPEAEDFLLPTKTAQKAVDLTPRGTTFGVSFLRAKSPVAQKVGLDLVETPFALRGVDRLDMEPSVETAANVANDRARIAITRTFQDAYTDYRKQAGISRPAAAFGRTGADMTERQFSEAVAKAMRRGDESDVPQVRAAAQKLRDEVVEPLKEKAIKAGLLPEDVSVSTAASYFTRSWDRDEIVARSPEFKARLTKHFQSGFRAGREAAEEGFEGLSDVELDGYASEAAESVYRTLVDHDVLPTGLGIVAKTRGPMKERTLNVQDLDFEDFLVSDAEFVLNRYARVMTADIALKDRFGSADLSQQIADIKSDYSKRIEEAKTEKERLDLKAEQTRIVERVEATRDLMRGTYQLGVRGAVPYRVMQSAMTFNFVRALGHLVVSALPDAYRAVMVHGAQSVWGGAVGPLIKNTRQFHAQAKELSEFAGIAEVALNNRLMRVADITDPMGNLTPVENTMNWMGAAASKYSGGTVWNDFFKNMAVMTTTNRLRKMSGSKADKAMLARLKLNKRDATSIQKAMTEHGVEADGVFDPMVSKWPQRLQDLYASALRADADTIVVTPGLGDKTPVVEAHQWLRPALQFKSFAIAAHSRIMIAGLQESQARFLMGMASMSAMGMFVFYLKALSSGRDISDNPGTWIAEGIDRSGMFPLLMEANNWWEGLNLPGVYSILSMGEDEASRYAVRSTSGKLLGPTAGLLNDSALTVRLGADIGKSLVSGDEADISKGDISAMRRLVPFGRHPGVKEYLDLWLVPDLKESID